MPRGIKALKTTQPDNKGPITLAVQTVTGAEIIEVGFSGHITVPGIGSTRKFVPSNAKGSSATIEGQFVRCSWQSMAYDMLIPLSAVTHIRLSK